MQSENKTDSIRQRRRSQAAKKIMDEGLRLMGTRGLHATKIEDITQAADIGKGTFFTHFASKEIFIAKLVDQVLSDLARRVRPLALAAQEPEALLSGVGGVHLRYFQLRPEAAALLTQAVSLSPGHPAGQEIHARLKQHLEMVAEIITPALTPMGWPEDRALELAAAVIALSCGFFWFGPMLNIGLDTPVNLLERMGRMLGRGLSRPEA